MEITIIVIATLLVIFIVHYTRKLFGNNKKNNELDAGWLLKEHNKNQPAKDEFNEIKKHVSRLSRGNANWLDIYQLLNPLKEQKILDLLTRYKGHHMFCPSVALNILEKCVKDIERQGLHVDITRLLLMAIEESDRIITKGR